MGEAADQRRHDRWLGVSSRNALGGARGRGPTPPPPLLEDYVPNAAPQSLSSKRLKPDTWHASFDSAGRLGDMPTLLRRILEGGVDAAIRAEVWEFLLGCYRHDSTAGERARLRQARRQRYAELLEQCRSMNDVLGTGRLPLVGGVRALDVRVVGRSGAAAASAAPAAATPAAATDATAEARAPQRHKEAMAERQLSRSRSSRSLRQHDDAGEGMTELITPLAGSIKRTLSRSRSLGRGDEEEVSGVLQTVLGKAMEGGPGEGDRATSAGGAAGPAVAVDEATRRRAHDRLRTLETFKFPTLQGGRVAASPPSSGNLTPAGAGAPSPGLAVAPPQAGAGRAGEGGEAVGSVAGDDGGVDGLDRSRGAIRADGAQGQLPSRPSSRRQSTREMVRNLILFSPSAAEGGAGTSPPSSPAGSRQPPALGRGPVAARSPSAATPAPPHSRPAGPHERLGGGGVEADWPGSGGEAGHTGRASGSPDRGGGLQEPQLQTPRSRWHGPNNADGGVASPVRVQPQFGRALTISVQSFSAGDGDGGDGERSREGYLGPGASCRSSSNSPLWGGGRPGAFATAFTWAGSSRKGAGMEQKEGRETEREREREWAWGEPTAARDSSMLHQSSYEHTPPSPSPGRSPLARLLTRGPRQPSQQGEGAVSDAHEGAAAARRQSSDFVAHQGGGGAGQYPLSTPPPAAAPRRWSHQPAGIDVAELREGLEPHTATGSGVGSRELAQPMKRRKFTSLFSFRRAAALPGYRPHHLEEDASAAAVVRRDEGRSGGYSSDPLRTEVVDPDAHRWHVNGGSGEPGAASSRAREGKVEGEEEAAAAAGEAERAKRPGLSGSLPLWLPFARGHRRPTASVEAAQPHSDRAATLRERVLAAAGGAPRVGRGSMRAERKTLPAASKQSLLSQLREHEEGTSKAGDGASLLGSHAPSGGEGKGEGVLGARRKLLPFSFRPLPFVRGKMGRRPHPPAPLELGRQEGDGIGGKVEGEAELFGGPAEEARTPLRRKSLSSFLGSPHSNRARGSPSPERHASGSDPLPAAPPSPLAAAPGRIPERGSQTFSGTRPTAGSGPSSGPSPGPSSGPQSSGEVAATPVEGRRQARPFSRWRLSRDTSRKDGSGPPASTNVTPVLASDGDGGGGVVIKGAAEPPAWSLGRPACVSAPVPAAAASFVGPAAGRSPDNGCNGHAVGHATPVAEGTNAASPARTGCSTALGGQKGDAVAALGAAATEKDVAEWLWTVHKIAGDVVRTDQHLSFFAKQENAARMLDVLAIHAWADTGTGYCQGMCDLLSPFLMLFDDNADAFWCFESLISRLRQNFVVEGPVGVIRQLDMLRSVLAVTDSKLLRRLEDAGGGSLLFAFRMLLLLFRREFPFSHVLFLWEMMWAADFDRVASAAPPGEQPKVLEVGDDAGGVWTGPHRMGDPPSQPHGTPVPAGEGSGPSSPGGPPSARPHTEAAPLQPLPAKEPPTAAADAAWRPWGPGRPLSLRVPAIARGLSLRLAKGARGGPPEQHQGAGDPDLASPPQPTRAQSLPLEPLPRPPPGSPPRTAAQALRERTLERSMSPLAKIFRRPSAQQGLLSTAATAAARQRPGRAPHGRQQGPADEDIGVFCVAAILQLNRRKLTRDFLAMDDLIKMFNDVELRVDILACVHTAIKIRFEYLEKLSRAPA